jgi:hypothetical protein
MVPPFREANEYRRDEDKGKMVNECIPSYRSFQGYFVRQDP